MMSEQTKFSFMWPVMKLCEKQLRDINPEDVIENGLYRKCNIYKGGGGYDKFEAIYQKRSGLKDKHFNNQFVVQVKGCPLHCPYCYVTPDGVRDGECVDVAAFELKKAFIDSGQDVFHLMGGAPALYINEWPELLHELYDDKVLADKPFHSDMLLIEKEYPVEVLREIKSITPQPLIAVSIKAANATEFEKNTGIPLTDEISNLFWSNMDKLVQEEFPFYLTYTGMSEDDIADFKWEIRRRYGLGPSYRILDDSFAIGIIHYEALD